MPINAAVLEADHQLWLARRTHPFTAQAV